MTEPLTREGLEEVEEWLYDPNVSRGSIQYRKKCRVLIATARDAMDRADMQEKAANKALEWNAQSCVWAEQARDRAEAAEARAEAAEAECKRLRGELANHHKIQSLLYNLAWREAEYRDAHDHYGDGDIKTGQAWDRMRRCGDEARATLNAKEPSDG